MNIKNPETTTVILKQYKDFTLCAKISNKNLKLYNLTHDEDLLLYKYCENGRPYNINHKMVNLHSRQSFHQEYLKERKELGFKST